jgi:hypothetical protein
MPAFPKWLQNLLSEDYVPEVLYHYTSHAGLTGIVEHRALWATNIQCLNDEREYGLARSIAVTIASELLELARGQATEPLWETCLTELQQLEPSKVYVASLSSHPDQLSQWRGYCPNANGYSFGVASSDLSTPPVFPEFLLARCIYDGPTQHNLVRLFLERIIRDEVSRARRRRAGTRSNQMSESVRSLFPILAPVLKDVAFREEGEWRLIAPAVETTDPRVRFRPGKSYIVPFLEAPIARTGTWHIPEIVIGPSPIQDVTKSSVETLLSRFGVTCGSVKFSAIPYRSW